MASAAILATLLLTAQAAEPSSVAATIRARPAIDRTDLHIELAWRPAKDETPTIQPPQDCYGTPGLGEMALDVSALQGTTLVPNAEGTGWTAAPGADGFARVTYRMSYPPPTMAGSPFSPNTGPGHFHIALCQWMLRVGGDDVAREYRVRLELPPEWRDYASGIDLRRGETGSLDDLASAVVGGSADGGRRILVEGRPVDIFVADDLDIPAAAIETDVQTIVTTQRAAMKDFDFPSYTIAVLRRDGFMAGTAPEGLFVAFVRPDVKRDALNQLLAHEMFHNWLLGRLRLVDEEGRTPAARLDWFHEGFTEYFGRRSLLDAGLIDQTTFVELFNADLDNLADHPHAAAGLDAAQEAVSQRRFDGDWKKLAYFRGALLALKWDHALRAGGHDGLLAHVRDLSRRAAQSDGALPLDDLLRGLEDAGVPARADDRRHIVEGEPIALSGLEMGPGWTLQSAQAPVWDPGFALRDTFRGKVMTGVRPDGPAWRAGLRDGMPFVRSSNAGRFTNAYRPDQPLEIVVMIDGEERAFAYRPEGAPRTRARFVRAAAGG